MKNTILFAIAILSTACSAKTLQINDELPVGIDRTTYREGLGYANTTRTRSSKYEYEVCKAEQAPRRTDADLYCLCLHTPADKAPTQCFAYGFGMGFAGGVNTNAGSTVQLAQFPNLVNTSDMDTSSQDARMYAPPQQAQASSSTTPSAHRAEQNVSSPWDTRKEEERDKAVDVLGRQVVKLKKAVIALTPPPPSAPAVEQTASPKEAK